MQPDKHCRGLAISVFIAGLLLAPAAGRVSASVSTEMLKEGRFDFNICLFGKTDYPRHARDLVGGAFDILTASMHDGGGTKDIGRPPSHCVGDYEIVGGTYRDHGICTRVDAEGDSWVMRFETGVDLAGTWSADGGSGKYEGRWPKARTDPSATCPA